MKMNSVLLVFLTAVLGSPLCAAKRGTPESAPVPGIEPLPFQEAMMSPDQLAAFFEPLKKGTPIQLILEKGKIVHGLYGSFDDYYDTIWIVPRGEPGVFKEKGYKLNGIKNAALWDKKKTPSSEPPAPAALKDIDPEEEHYLLKKEGY
jgi:hypothetical protein